MPVHLYGQAAEIKEIKEICDDNNLVLIEEMLPRHMEAKFDGISRVIWNRMLFILSTKTLPLQRA